MTKTALFFDLDGTLLDTLEDLFLAVNEMLESYGLPSRTLDEVRAFVGNGAARLVKLALPGLATDPSVEEAVARFKQIYNRICQDHTSPYPGVMEALAQLHDTGYPMAVVSNKPDGAVKELCGVHFGGFVSVCRGDLEGVPRKPAADMPLAAARELGAAAENCIYIGDSEVDILTAKNAGMVCLSVTWGFRKEAELIAAGGEYFVDDPLELPERIKLLEEKLLGK